MLSSILVSIQKIPISTHLLLWGYFPTHQPTHHIQSPNTDTIVDVCWVVFIFPPIIMSLPWILLHYVSCGYVSADVTLTIGLSPRKWQEGAEHHQKIFFGLVLSCLVLSCLVLSCFVFWCVYLCLNKRSSTMQCKADQYMCVFSKESFIVCSFKCLF